MAVEVSASAVGHLVAIAIKLAEKETNGHRFKVIVKSFEVFPTLVEKAEELKDFQSDDERLDMEGKALAYACSNNL